MRHVCNLIAANAERTRINPAGCLGAACRAAGAYWAIRAILLRAGADVADLNPSAPISAVACRFPEVFLEEIARLAPGRLPTVSIRSPWHDRAYAVIAIGILSMILASALRAEWIGAPVMTAMIWGGIGLLIAGSAAVVVAARCCDREVRFGSVATFRELAEVISTGEP